MATRLGTTQDGRFFMDTGEGPQEITAQQYARHQTAQDTGPIEAAMVGMGERFHNLGEKLGMLDPTGVSLDELQQQRPISTTVGQALPYIAAAPMAASLPAVTAAGVGTGFAFAPEGQELQEGIAGGLGGLAGGMATRVLGNILSNTQYFGRGGGEMADQFERTGGQLTPAQRSNSASMKAAEARFESNPFTADLPQKIADANQDNINRLAARAMGLDDPSITRLSDDVMMQIERQQGDAFAEIGERLDPVTIPADEANKLRTLVEANDVRQASFRETLGQDYPESGPIELSGPALMRVRSKLSEYSASNNTDTATLAINRLNKLDDQIERAVGADYSKVRQQYMLKQKIDKLGAMSSEGDINPRSAFGNIRAWRDDMLPEIAEFRENVQAASSRSLTPKFGRSGTAERQGSLLDPRTWMERVPAKMYYSKGGFDPSMLATQVDPYNESLGAMMGAGLLAPE